MNLFVTGAAGFEARRRLLTESQRTAENSGMDREVQDEKRQSESTSSSSEHASSNA